MSLYKKVSSHGSINIPVALRRELGIEPRDAMEVDAENGKIVIKPYVERCIFCRGEDKVRRLNGKGVCESCLEKLNQKGEK